MARNVGRETFSLDPDVCAWLKTHKNKSGFVNGILRQVMMSNYLPVPRMLCIEYDSVWKDVENDIQTVIVKECQDFHSNGYAASDYFVDLWHDVLKGLEVEDRNKGMIRSYLTTKIIGLKEAR